MLKFISLGSGSSGNCYFLNSANDGLLIDAGIGIRTLKKNLRDYGLNISNIHNIIVTHDHADHIKSVGALSSELHIPVYATSKVHEGIERNYCVKKKVSKENIRILTKGETLKVGEFEVTPFDVPHDSTDNVGFRISWNGIIFCLITDAGYVTDEMKKQISVANYLVLEANYDETMLETGPYPVYLKRRIASNTGHLSNDSCANALAENMTDKLKKVWFCHISEENNHPELVKKTIEAALGEQKSLSVLPSPCVLKRKSPTGIFELS